MCVFLFLVGLCKVLFVRKESEMGNQEQSPRSFPLINIRISREVENFMIRAGFDNHSELTQFAIRFFTYCFSKMSEGKRMVSLAREEEQVAYHYLVFSDMETRSIVTFLESAPVFVMKVVAMVERGKQVGFIQEKTGDFEPLPEFFLERCRLLEKT